MKTASLNKLKVKVGEWGFITGDNRILPAYWEKQFKRGLFGKVIDVQVRFSPFDGRRFEDQLMVRCYTKNGRTHIKTTPKYFNLYT